MERRNLKRLVAVLVEIFLVIVILRETTEGLEVAEEADMVLVVGAEKLKVILV